MSENTTIELTDMIDQYLDKHSKYLTIQQYSQKTIYAYKKDLLLFAKYLKTLKKTQYSYQQNVTEFLRFLHQKKYHPNSIYRTRCGLKNFFDYLIQHKKIDKSPLKIIYKFKRKKNTQEWLSSNTFEKISNTLFHSDNTSHLEKPNSNNDEYLSKRDQIIWESLYGLGLRISELTYLKLDKIDLSQNLILVIGKKAQSNLLPLTPKLKHLITNYLTSRKKFLQQKKKFHHFFLANNHGTPITTRGVRHAFMNQLKKNQILEKIYPHMLRHSIATHLLENGADIKRVQQLLRHKSITSTQIYTHLSKKALKTSYQKFHPLALVSNSHSS